MTRLEQIMESFSPVLGVAMIVVILNLGAPLDYHLILGAGLFTVIYILARAAGKYFGAYFGASITRSPETVKKYLGLTLLPHSGVSLVFTGIAVSVLSGPAPDCAKIVQGTIAAAAVINEVIAVITAKKGFEWAGELNASGESPAPAIEHTIITISRHPGNPRPDRLPRTGRKSGQAGEKPPFLLSALYRQEFRRRGKLRYVPEQRLPGYGGMCKNHLLRLPRPGKPLNHTGPCPSCRRREPAYLRFSCPVLDRSDFFRNLLNFFAFWHYNPNDRMEKC